MTDTRCAALIDVRSYNYSNTLGQCSKRARVVRVVPGLRDEPLCAAHEKQRRRYPITGEQYESILP